MAKNNMLIYLVLAAGAAVYYFKFGGKEQLDNLLGGLNLNGNSNQSTSIQRRVNTGTSTTVSGDGQWTDEKGNKINVQGGGQICIDGKCYGSGSSGQRLDLTNGGFAIKNKSTSMFTFPNRFGNL